MWIERTMHATLSTLEEEQGKTIRTGFPYYMESWSSFLGVLKQVVELI